MLVGVHRRVYGVLEGEVRRLGMSTRGLDCPPASVGPADLLRVCAGVHALHNALPEDPVELLVEGRRGSDEVVREVGPAKIAQVERSELAA